MRHLHVESPCGIAGDMFLAALLDLGVPLDPIRAALRSLPLEETFQLEARRVLRGGIAATRLFIDEGEGFPDEHAPLAGEAPSPSHGHGRSHEHHHHHPHEHGHGHPHHHHHAQESKEDAAHDHARHHHGPLRRFPEIRALLEQGALAPAVRERAERVFRRLAEAEAEVHGMQPDEIHFHEVSGLDTLIDIVGVSVALEELGVESVTAGPVSVGTGFVTCAHGVLPLPAPATAALLRGAPVRQIDTGVEIATPTGAALLAALVSRFGPAPAMRLERIGYGAGSRLLPGRSNTLRLLLGDTEAQGGTPDTVLQFTAVLDDTTGEALGHALERLLEAGALDAYVRPVVMKKSRPGHELVALVPHALRAVLLDLFLRETSTFGVRIEEVARETLERTELAVPLEGGPVRVKVGWLAGRPVKVAPEYKDCRRHARESRLPLAEVYRLATDKAWRSLE